MEQQAFDWGPYLAFAFVSSFTPGPNVILLAGSGSAWGFKRSIPHLLGVCFGFPLMLLLVQLGAERAFAAMPWLFAALTAGSLLYALWLAAKIFKMGFDGPMAAQAGARPMSFMEAVAFQWVNGKAWQMVLMVATLYAADSLRLKLLEALAFFLVLLVTTSFWVELGKRISSYLANPLVRRAYYAVLSLALILSTVPTGVSLLLKR